jgi:hypothetical protein
MNELSGRRGTLIIAGLLLGATFIVGSTLLGGQVSTVLSKVGASVGGGTVGSGVDTTGSGQDTTGGGPATSGPGTGGQVADAGATVPTLLIIRTGELTLQVQDLGAAVRDGDAAVTRAGGYINGSTQSGVGADEAAQATYRIPSAAWQSTLAALHGLASTVVSESIKTDEVTGQVVDLTAHIANLRATEAALQAIMAKAAKISDVLDVQAQLTTTRGEIERLVGNKAHLVDQASYGSLAVTYRLPVVPAPKATLVPPKGWDPADDVSAASGKLVGIGQATTSIGIWLAIVGLPIVIASAILLFGAWQIYRLARWLVRRRETALPEA